MSRVFRGILFSLLHQVMLYLDTHKASDSFRIVKAMYL